MTSRLLPLAFAAFCLMPACRARAQDASVLCRNGKPIRGGVVLVLV
jgi:hypothetical protein